MTTAKGGQLLHATLSKTQQLSTLLTKTFAVYQVRGETEQTSGHRVDIVSERLCDDVIQYLAPTLEQHKGCTIIDVHPGACLWSSKLHDFLRPKRHVLMEPEMRYLDPFIKPLLERPNSTYRHTTLTGAHPSEYWDNYRKVLDDPELTLHPRPPTLPDDPKRRKLDPSLLVIGNLWRRYKGVRINARSVSLAQLFLQHMSYGALTNNIFHRSGLIRMLWWMPETTKGRIFAENILQRSSFNVGLDIAARVSEVAGVATLESLLRSKSNIGYCIEGAQALVHENVKDAMSTSGMELPAGRRFLHVDSHLQTGATEPTKLLSPFHLHCTDLHQLNKVLDQTRDRMKSVIALSVKNTHRRSMVTAYEAALKSIRYPQSRTMVKNRDSRTVPSPSLFARMVIFLDLHICLLNLEANFKELEERRGNAEALAEARQSILGLDAELHNMIRIGGATYTDHVSRDVDDLISHYLSPPLLSKDKRQYEAFAMYPDEVFPTFDLMLLDVTPTERDLSVPEIADSKEGARVCQELLKTLFGYRSRPLPWALDRIAPNAAQDLIPHVPAITDARKGGRLNPDRMRPRMLTEEMVEGLVKAFLEWPFRPASWELALAAGEIEGAATSEAEKSEAEVPV